MKNIIFLDAGHSVTDSGAVSGAEQESYHARRVRDELRPLLERHFTVMCVPDNLDLTQTVKWINRYAKNLEDGYAFAIHLNSNAGKAGNGAEAWYCGGSPEGQTVKVAQKITQTIIDKYCALSGYGNRGIHSDLASRFHRLGFVRDTNCFAGLIELCFINNKDEINFLKNNYQLIAKALYTGICNSYGIREEQEDMRIVTQEILAEIYWDMFVRTPDAGAQGYIGKEETFVRAELRKSAERKEVETDVINARNERQAKKNN